MFIKSINIKNTYSFGECGTPELGSLKKVNLFIGKNGSGKTNIVRSILDLPIGRIHLGDNVDNKILPSKDPEKIFNGITGAENFYQYLHQGFRIETDEGIIKTKPLNEITPFVNNRSGKASVFDKNSYELFKKIRKSAVYLKSSRSSINPQMDDQVKEMVQFGFYYIFNKIVTFNVEHFDEYKSFGLEKYQLGGHPVAIEIAPDGYLLLINLFKTIFENKKELIFLEEPENHIEPRALKKLISFLVYFLFGKEYVSQWLMNDIESKLTEYDKLASHGSNHTCPRGSFGQIIHNRPTYLGRTPRERKDFVSKCEQLFIISHSPVIIDCVSELNKYKNGISSIYEIYEEKVGNKHSANEIAVNLIGGEKILTEISRVKKIETIWDSLDLLDNLGIKSSDILLANGIIWVEGPSDAIYIKKFVDIYIENNEFVPVEVGRSYTFGIYGGVLLSSYYLSDGSSSNEPKKIVSLLKANKNFYVVMDSDAIEKEIGEVADKSTFGKHKDFIAEEIKKMKDKYDKIGCWYSKGNTNYQAIEDYVQIDGGVLDEIGVKDFGKKNKVGNAIRIVKYLNENKIILKDINIDLDREIGKMYEKIKQWNA